MEREEFEKIVEEEYEALPDLFRATMENIRIIVEDVPPAGRKARGMLLGEYMGIPLTKRGADYGMYPVIPDTITLYKRNLESLANVEPDLRRHIRETLIHEIGHYFGMSEAEIRRAGY
ncbi:MAG: metallopeptidase family protein [Bacteroidetes bacterium]|nr:metallopeptidase family protein [Bacteroidota bacterium]